MSEPYTIKVDVTHKYEVRAVTRWEVVHSSTEHSPNYVSMAFANAVCSCDTEEKAKEMANLLAATKARKPRK